VSFLGGFAAAISEALFQVSTVAPGVYWAFTGAVTMATILFALVLQRRNLIKLTHRRPQPYFPYFDSALPVGSVGN